MEKVSSEPSFDAQIPSPSVELLAKTIIDSYARAQCGTDSGPTSLKSETEFLRSEMEKRIEQIKAMSKPRTQLPPRFDRLPFICLKPFAKLILRIYAFIFKEEREIDLLILDALGDLQQLSEATMQHLDTIPFVGRDRADANHP